MTQIWRLPIDVSLEYEPSYVFLKFARGRQRTERSPRKMSYLTRSLLFADVDATLPVATIYYVATVGAYCQYGSVRTMFWKKNFLHRAAHSVVSSVPKKERKSPTPIITKDQDRSRVESALEVGIFENRLAESSSSFNLGVPSRTRTVRDIVGSNPRILIRRFESFG
jgi:hypothetical protein